MTSDVTPSTPRTVDDLRLPDVPHDEPRSLDLVRAGDVAMLTTRAVSGAMTSRPLTVAEVHGRALQVSVMDGENWSAPGTGAPGRLVAVVGAAPGRDATADAGCRRRRPSTHPARSAATDTPPPDDPPGQPARRGSSSPPSPPAAHDRRPHRDRR